MIALSLQDIADITGGRLDHVSDPQLQVTGPVEFDSRHVDKGALFVALPGARVDGHDFAEDAIANGATAVLAARPVGVPAIVVEPKGQVEGDGANADVYANDSDGSAAVVVGALSDLARAVTNRLITQSGLNVIGVTGSAGKTSTKDLLASILITSDAGDTVAPPGSYNNEIGHPYTALRCDENTKYFVAEMSARGVGHIRHLASIARPRIGVVLNVGTAHLGEFGSRENIARAKGELVEALPSAEEGGVAVLNADDEFVSAMASRTSAKVVYYSAAQVTPPNVDYYATDIELDTVARASFTLHCPQIDPVRVKLQVFGAHQVSNALAAAAAACEAGIPVENVVEALGGHRNASAHRMDVVTRHDGVTVINDSYNANPESMRAAIAALGYTAAGRPDARAVAVLGEMNELGIQSAQAHREVGGQLAKYHVDNLIVVGQSEPCAALADEARRRGIQTVQVPDAPAAAEEAARLLRTAPSGVEDWKARDEKDVVLVKASNSAGLWRVAEDLLGSDPGARGGGGSQ